MMKDDNEHLEEKRNRRQIPSEDPNSLDVDLSFISPIFNKVKVEYFQISYYSSLFFRFLHPPSWSLLSFLTLIATNPSSSDLQPHYPSNWLLPAITSQERWWMKLRCSPPSHLCFHSHMRLSHQQPREMFNRFTFVLCCW